MAYTTVGHGLPSTGHRGEYARACAVSKGATFEARRLLADDNIIAIPMQALHVSRHLVNAETLQFNTAIAEFEAVNKGVQVEDCWN